MIVTDIRRPGALNQAPRLRMQLRAACCARRLSAFAAILLVGLVLGGCGQTKAQEAALAECPNGVLAGEGKCETVAAARHEKHVEQVEHEAGEVESVLKKNRAAETARAIEAIGGQE